MYIKWEKVGKVLINKFMLIENIPVVERSSLQDKHTYDNQYVDRRIYTYHRREE